MNSLIRYEMLKDQMKTGDLLQWQTNSLIGKGIQWFTKSPYSHSSLVIRLSEYEGLERRRFTTEAMAHGVVLNLLSKRLFYQKGHCWWFPLKDEWDCQREQIGERALAFVGTPYDFKSIARFVFGRVSEDVQSLFCSELAYIAYGYEGVPPSPAGILRLGIFKPGVAVV